MAKMSVLAGIGLALAVAGFVYGVVAVGVPAQDPTPAQAAAERFNLALSGWAMAVGGVVMVVGIIGMAIAASRGRAHGDENGICPRHGLRQIEREGQPPRLHVLGHQIGQARFKDRHLSGLKSGNLLGVLVDADHIVAEI
jgi:hypothetical protein